MKLKTILPLALAALAMPVCAANKAVLTGQDEIAADSSIGSGLRHQLLDLKFTAVDGTKVDLAKLRGHVVLVDFWATWCGPCRAEVPEVVAAYRKYHDQGFDVIGVSLDQEKQALLSFTEATGMVWPQYFDGGDSPQNPANRYGVEAIPTMWLVNQNGEVVNVNARGNLDAEVAALLRKAS